MLERERVVSENFPAPAPERPHLGVVVAGDGVDFIGAGDQLLGDVVLFAAQLEQHLQEIGGRAGMVGGRLRPARLGPGRRRRGPHRGDDAEKGVRGLLAHMAPAQAAQVPELFAGPGFLRRDVVHRLVAQHPVSRHVAALRFGLAPGREVAQHRQLARLSQAGLDPEPGRRRIEAVDRRVGERGHLLGKPALALVAVEPGGDLFVDDAEMGDVGDRVVVHFPRQGPARPIGEALRLVYRRARQLRDQPVVAHLVAEPADHRRDLGIEDRPRNAAVEMVEDLDILARGVEHLEHRGIAHQPEKRRQIDVRRHRVDRRRLVHRGKLHQAQARPIRAVAHELGVDGDVTRGREPIAKGAKGPGVGDEMHGRVYTRFHIGGKATPGRPPLA